MATRYLYILETDFLARRALLERKLLLGRRLSLGEPVIETSGTNRRVMWVHDFPAAWLDGPITLTMDDGTLQVATLTSVKPVWRR